MAVLLSALAGYLMGSFSGGIFFSRHMYKDDVRLHGSRSAGMTNMLRTYGKGAAALVFAVDFFKGAAAVLAGRLIFYWLGAAAPAQGLSLAALCSMPVVGGLFADGGLIAGLAAVIGHMLPLYFGFKGGKGIATSAGAILVVNPAALGVILTVFLVLAIPTGIVSLGSVAAAASLPAAVYFLAPLLGRQALPELWYALAICALALLRHRANIGRLLRHEEPSFRHRAK